MSLSDKYDKAIYVGQSNSLFRRFGIYSFWHDVVDNIYWVESKKAIGGKIKNRKFKTYRYPGLILDKKQDEFFEESKSYICRGI